jgi:integrase
MTDAHLRPAKKRLGYYDSSVRAAVPPPPRRAGVAPTLDEMVEALIAHRTDWAEHTTQRNCRHYLKGSRWKDHCAAHGVERADQLTTEHVETFLAEQRALVSGDYLIKFRTYFRALAAFQRDVPGFGSGLQDIERVRKPRGSGRRKPPALSKEQERDLVELADGRDRLLVEFLLATGLRVSELCGLLLEHLHLDEDIPYVHVLGSIHDPDNTKGEEDRDVPFRPKYRTLPVRLRGYLAERTDTRQELFLSSKPDAQGRPAPLTISGVQQLCARLGVRLGVHVYPHLLRHTWATRLVDAGMGTFHLKQAGGWKSLEMVRTYYRADNREMLEAFHRLRE